jgi:hypothetical protein
MRRYLPVVLLIAFVFVTDVLLAQGCSQCKLLSEQGSEVDENSFGSNINFGILYLMIIPYLLIMFLFRKQIIAFFKKLFAKKNPA